MLQGDNSGDNSEHLEQNLEVIPEPIFTPEVFAPNWQGKPESILDLELNFPYNAQEWDFIFSTLISLISHKNYNKRNSAIRSLISALGIIPDQKTNDPAYQLQKPEIFLQQILTAIASQVKHHPDIFEIFCKSVDRFEADSSYLKIILAWLKKLEAEDHRKYPLPEDICAAKIFLGAYDDHWQIVGSQLLTWLDHTHLNIRACAAAQIAKLYTKVIAQQMHCYSYRIRRWTDSHELMSYDFTKTDLPPLDAMLDLITQKEIERPGVAGAFLWKSPKAYFDAKAWLLTLLERSPSPEPAISYFPCDLSFEAHEVFSDDAAAIRRLIKMGRSGIALMAAIDRSEAIEELKPILIEFGESEHPETVRLATWHLAYYYHYLHPRGLALGYVEHLEEVSEVDLYVLFSRHEPDENPYAAVIHPKEQGQKLSQAIAQKWVDRIFPESVRGKPNNDPCHRGWYQRGYVDQGRHLTDKPPEFVDQVIIGYRSKLPWHPRLFCNHD